LGLALFVIYLKLWKAEQILFTMYDLPILRLFFSGAAVLMIYSDLLFNC